MWSWVELIAIAEDWALLGRPLDPASVDPW